MGDLTSNRVTLRNKFELEKFRSKVVKSLPVMEASPSNCRPKQKAMDMEEIVKHMKHLPSYLEKGKPISDRALSFGVIEWGRLEKWQNKYHHQHGHHHQSLFRSNKCSPSSSNSSSLFSTDGSSPRSSRDQSCSPARQKVHRVTLQSHFEASPKEDLSPPIKLCLENVEKAHYYKNPLKISESLFFLGNGHTPPSCSKGKFKVRDESPDPSYRTCNDDQPVLFLARSGPGTIQTNGRSPSRDKTPVRTRPSGSSKSSDNKASNIPVNKPRSTSPLRRFSFSLSTSSKSAAPTSERPESPTSQKSTDGKRGHTSPLRRLLDPIFPSKAHQNAETGHEDSRTKAKVKLDFGNSNGIRKDDDTSSRKQALFQTTVKNNRLLFTFAVENNKHILAATVTSLASSGKDNKNLLFTFFTVQEVKKKSISWLSQGNKSKDQAYVPNVTAQMKVSNSHCDTREFVLFSVDPNVQPQEELEAIVVKFSRKSNGANNQERFSTTVILPGGIHGVPSKGEPSPLIDRWRSGGVCDCGGWDEGCRFRTLTNHAQSSGSRSKVHVTGCQFDLFVQGENKNKRPVFNLSPLKEGIFSADYNSSLSPLQAFAICMSVVESRKTSQHTEVRAHAHNGTVPKIYTPIPRIKKNTTGKVASL